MIIIPVINCADFDGVRTRLALAQEFLCDHGSEEHQVSCGECWVHIDVADGGFTADYTTWRNPDELRALRRDEHLKIEIHLMVREPELVLDQWLGSGINRLIVHLETVVALDTIISRCADRGVECFVALAPETSVEKLVPYAGLIAGCQVLAVTPGPAGQAAGPGILEKIRSIRGAYPSLPIEVDGGVTVATAPEFLAAGATQLAAGTAIFKSEDPGAAYRALVAAAR